METFIQYSTKNLLASYKVCLCFYCYTRINIVWYDCLISVGIKIFMDFVEFLIQEVHEVLHTWCSRYNICSAWFVDIRISTCLHYDDDVHS